MATFTGWYYTGDQPTQEMQFEADESLKNDREELETVMRREMRKRFDRSTAQHATIESIAAELDRDAMLANIIEMAKELYRREGYRAGDYNDGAMFFYDKNDKPVVLFNAGEVLRAAIDYIQATGSKEVEIRQGGLRLFIVKAIY
nr:MAG TPA: hypothetical protein [Caudoviricetes sp.]